VLPVPATFDFDSSGKMVFRHVEADDRLRALAAVLGRTFDVSSRLVCMVDATPLILAPRRGIMKSIKVRTYRGSRRLLA